MSVNFPIIQRYSFHEYKSGLNDSLEPDSSSSWLWPSWGQDYRTHVIIEQTIKDEYSKSFILSQESPIFSNSPAFLA